MDDNRLFKELLTTFFAEFMELFFPDAAEAIMQLTTSWHERGRAEGRAEGIAEGIKKGKIERDIEIAKNALKKGFSIEDIVELTGLQQETVLKLKEKMD